MKYPKIKVKLTGKNGNAYNLLGLVNRALEKGKVSKKERNAFLKEAMSGDYNHLLATCCEWVNVS